VRVAPACLKQSLLQVRPAAPTTAQAL